MTLEKAIEIYRDLYETDIKPSVLAEWISELDSTIFNELISTHSDGKKAAFDGYSFPSDLYTELLLEKTYTELYIRYLALKTHLLKNDTVRYNNELSVFNSMYKDYSDHYNRTHLPIKKVDFWNI